MYASLSFLLSHKRIAFESYRLALFRQQQIGVGYSGNISGSGKRILFIQLNSKNIYICWQNGLTAFDAIAQSKD